MKLSALTPTRVFSALALCGISAAALIAAMQFVRADLRAEIYKERLESLAEEFESLSTAYNQAVMRTAVTELIVSKDNQLSVRVRDASGVTSEIPTRFNPSEEIYIDYVIANSRLLVRRVFDAHTPPVEGLLLDETLETLGWSDRNASVSYGKAVYRELSPGRWVVSVSGDGSLGLSKLNLTEEDSPELTYAPALGDFDVWLKQTDEDAQSISIGQAISAFFTP